MQRSDVPFNPANQTFDRSLLLFQTNITSPQGIDVQTTTKTPSYLQQTPLCA